MHSHSAWQRGTPFLEAPAIVVSCAAALCKATARPDLLEAYRLYEYNANFRAYTA